VNIEKRREMNICDYNIIQEIIYPVSTASLNELSKCVVSGSGKRISQRRLTDKHLAIIELIYNFKTCTIEQIKRFLQIKGYYCSDINILLFNINNQYSIINLIRYTYSNEVESNKKEKVACLMGSGLHLINNYTNHDLDENISTFNKLGWATQKRTSYNLRFTWKTRPSIDIYLDLLEMYKDKINLIDFRMKIKDLTETIPYIAADLLISYSKSGKVNNLLIRGFCDLEKDRIDYLINMIKSYNAFSEDVNYRNFYLPITDTKPRLLLVTNHHEILSMLKKALDEANVPLDYVDILHYSETKEYFNNIFSEEICLEDLDENIIYDYELERCKNA